MRLFVRRSKPRSDALADLQRRFPDARQDDLNTILAVQPYTMTSPERVLALCQAVRYVCEHRILGDIVECGVWRGGSAIAAMRTLSALNDSKRRFWLYDTYEGMTDPTAEDVDFSGRSAHELLGSASREVADSVWCCASLEDVRANIAGCGYPQDDVQYVVGPVEQTLVRKAPNQIALLRLDTDWYESTRIELEVLFPRLVCGGVLLIDDYGHWEGCRRAVDEFLARQNVPMLLHRIDYTGRIGIRCAA